MQGCKPLSQNETDLILEKLKSTRDKTLFVLMLYTGFRIKEVLSIRVKDVLGDRLTVERRNMKNKLNSRTILLHPIVKQFVKALINEQKLSPDHYLFQSKKGVNQPIRRIQAWRLINSVVQENNLTGKIALHSTRKTFAEKIYQLLDKDLIKTSKALGHKNINSTVSYLSFKTEELDAAILDLDKKKS